MRMTFSHDYGTDTLGWTLANITLQRRQLRFSVLGLHVSVALKDAVVLRRLAQLRGTETVARLEPQRRVLHLAPQR